MGDATTKPGTLVLLRHGESEWNALNLFTGWVDVDLTDKGRAEAIRGGELIVEHDLRFISSIADKTVVLAHGRTIYDGDPAGIRRDARVIESYIGTRRERQDA